MSVSDALLLRLAAAGVRERERRRAEREAKNLADWDKFLGEIAQMGDRMLQAAPHPAFPDYRKLAEMFTEARTWPEIDKIRIPADRSKIEAVALIMTRDFELALALLLEDIPTDEERARMGG